MWESIIKKSVVLGHLYEPLSDVLTLRSGKLVVMSNYYEDFINALRYKYRTKNKDVHIYWAPSKLMLGSVLKREIIIKKGLLKSKDVKVSEFFITEPPIIPATADKEIREYDAEMIGDIGKLIKKDGVLCVDAQRGSQLQNIEPFIKETQMFKNLGIVPVRMTETTSLSCGMWSKIKN